MAVTQFAHHLPLPGPPPSCLLPCPSFPPTLCKACVAEVGTVKKVALEEARGHPATAPRGYNGEVQ